jgi:putative SOS response-associated peptidase YedK
MCSNYEPVTDNHRLLARFGVTLPEGVDPTPCASAGVMAPVIVRAEPRPAEALGEARFGLMGLLPHFATDISFARHSYNCRSETMKSKPAFRESWWAGRRCVIPVQRLSEWSYETGRPEMWHIQQADESPLGLAGLWSEWTSPAGETLLSFSMLTLNADGHAVFGRMNAPDHEKRMPVILPAEAQGLWLYGSLKDAERLVQRYPAELLQAMPRDPAAKAPREPKSWAAVPDMFAPEWHAVAAAAPRRKPVRSPRAVRPAPPEQPGPATGELF